MKIKTTLQSTRIKIEEPSIDDVYYIEQGEDGNFYITSENGYNGYEGDGFTKLETAIKEVNKKIKMYFVDRCLN